MERWDLILLKVERGQSERLRLDARVEASASTCSVLDGMASARRSTRPHSSTTSLASVSRLSGSPWWMCFDRCVVNSSRDKNPSWLSSNFASALKPTATTSWPETSSVSGFMRSSKMAWSIVETILTPSRASSAASHAATATSDVKRLGVACVPALMG